jgi:cytochrome P450
MTLRAIVRRVVDFTDPAAEEAIVRDVLYKLGNLDEPLSFFLYNLGSDRSPAWMRRLSDAWPASRRAARLQARMLALFSEELDRKLAASGPGRGGSLLGELAERVRRDDSPRTRRETLDLLNLLVLTGHESAATSTSWLLYELLGRPDMLARVRRELDELPAVIERSSDLDPTPYLDAAIHESLRRNTVVPVVSRATVSPMTICGYEIPAGAFVLPSQYLVHRDPARWEDPMAFRPERFLGGKPPLHDYFPFGGGTHKCIGADMGFLQIKCLATRILQQVDLSLVSRERPRAHFDVATVIPRGGVPVRVEARRTLREPVRRTPRIRPLAGV